jgi:hypothetical protein
LSFHFHWDPQVQPLFPVQVPNQNLKIKTNTTTKQTKIITYTQINSTQIQFSQKNEYKQQKWKLIQLNKSINQSINQSINEILKRLSWMYYFATQLYQVSTDIEMWLALISIHLWLEVIATLLLYVLEIHDPKEKTHVP